MKTNAYDIFATIYDAEQSWLEQLNKHFLRRLGDFPNNIVIEIGCGTGILGKLLIEVSNYYIGLDLSLEMLKEFKNKTINNTPQTSLLHCDVTQAWPISIKGDSVFFSVNTICNIVPVKKQEELLIRIGSDYLKSEGWIIIMFSNYFKWTSEDIPNLFHHNQINDSYGTTWTIQSRYIPLDDKKLFLSEFKCNSSDGRTINFSYPFTWQPLDFYLSALKQAGFNNQILNFEGMPFVEDKSDFLIIKATRG